MNESQLMGPLKQKVNNAISDAMASAGIDAAAVTNSLHIGSWLRFVNVTINGLRVENSVATVPFRDLPLAVKHAKPEERRFSFELPCSDHFETIPKLLGWYHAVTKANDLLGDSKGDNSLTSWKSLKRDIEVSPNGKLLFKVEQAFPCAWRIEGVSNGKTGSFVMEFSYEKCSRINPSDRSGNTVKNKETPGAMTCSLKFGANDNGILNIKSISDFGAKCGVETILLSSSSKWINIKDGELAYSPLRLEVEANGQDSNFNKLLELQKDSQPTYTHMKLVLHSNQSKVTNLTLKLSHVLIRSIEFANVKASESAKYIIEILPREVQVESPHFENRETPKSYQNFTIGLSAEKVVLEAKQLNGPGQNTVWKESPNYLHGWKSSYLVIKPTFLASSYAVNFSPPTNRTSDTSGVDRMSNPYLDAVVTQDHHVKTKLGAESLFGFGDWEGADQRVKIEFYAYTSATTPVSLDSSSLHEKLDNFLLFLLFGDTSLFKDGTLTPTPEEKTRLPKSWNESKLFDRNRYFVQIDTKASSGLVLAIESGSYVADRFDTFGKAARYRVQLIGITSGLQ